LESNLFKYIWRHSRKEQLVILAIVALSQLFYFLSLDLPKAIVNRAIQGQAFADGKTTTLFFPIAFDVPGFLQGIFGKGHVVLYEGFPLEQVPYLVALSLLFLLLVIINGVFKLQINTQKGRMGERMLRRLRYELFDRVLRFPQLQFRRVKQAEIATMIKDEVEPLGGFIGDAFVAPAFLGGQAVTALAFILAQSWWLGAITVAILLAQVIIIPKLRVKVLMLGKARQLTARQLAGRIAECVDGSADIHAHDTSNYERADIATRLARIFDIRFELYQRKFAVKFLNNMLAQLTPFLFYLVGGYLAITGHLDIGGLVAVISAYKDLPGPVKELIDWDQQRQDVQIKYEQVIDQFQPDGVLAAELQAIDAPTPPLEGDVAFSNLTVIDEAGARVLDGVGVNFPLTAKIAVIGPGGSGREGVALALMRLMPSAAGGISIGGKSLADMPEALIGRHIAYAGPEPYLFPFSVRENLLYGLKHRPVRMPTYDDETLRKHEAAIREARRSGNPDFDLNADWIDYESAGVDGPEALEAKLTALLKTIELDEDVYQLGLRGTIDPTRRPDLAAAVVAARSDLARRLADPQLAALVEPFDPDRYNKNMSVAENLLFGTAKGDLAPERLVENDYIRRVLERLDLIETLVDMGRQIAETMIEIFADLPPGHPFFEQFSFISAEDLPQFRAILGQFGKTGVAGLDKNARVRLIQLTLPYIEARHRLGLVDEAMERRLLEARRNVAEGLPDELRGSIEFYDRERYNAIASLQDNILFGRLVYGQAQALQKIGRLIVEVLDARHLRESVLGVGLDFHVGIAGKRLTAAQRQKIGLGRALLKRPQLLVLNEATSLLDNASQMRIAEAILGAKDSFGVLWVLHRADLARRFERVLVMRDGRLLEQGPPADLDRSGTTFHELVSAA
jgi:putative ABC transport system ATP-binding protein